MSVGSATCTANIMGPGVCNVVVVQRVVNAALGQACVTGSGHSASLAWVASPSTGVVGYNVYRGTVSGGPYTLLNTTPVSAVAYQDISVLAGQTYYYVVKAVGSGGALSVASNEIQAVVPSP
jgi:fibronectin type 3 domain-containing protein